MAGTALPARLPGPQKYKAPKKSAGQARSETRKQVQTKKTAQMRSNSAEAARKRAGASPAPSSGGGPINWGTNVKPQAPGIYIGPKQKKP